MAIPPQFQKAANKKAVPVPTAGADGLPSGLMPNKSKGKNTKQSAADKKKAFLKNKLKNGGF